jgi:hypothetical protein
VREDRDRAGLLYAGTEFGMFISFDDGATWKSFQLNMPNVPINQITLHNKDLVIATQGRAFWVFDNVSALQQLAPATGPITAPAAPKLFKPRDGYRTRSSPETLGPTLDYYLPAAPEGHVTIEILDAKGQVANTYSSAAPAGGGAGRGGRGGRGGGGGGGQAAADPEAAVTAARTAAANAQPVGRVTRNAGFNRFVWDVRHQNGLTMAPAPYTARVKVGDATLTEVFTVLIDPRVAEDGVTAADLQEQFDHGVKMSALVQSVTQTVQRVRAAQTQFANGATADPVKLKQVTAMADKLNTQPIRYGRPGLQAHIQYASRLGLSVDQKVGRDAIERYGVLKAELDKIIEELNGIVK